MSTVITEDEHNELMHYGILRRSGRYPWGSGANPNQRSKAFLDHIQSLKDQGLSDVEICRGLSTPEHKFTTTDLRKAKTIARNEIKAGQISQAVRLKDRGYSNVAIGKRMGLNESSVRSLLSENAQRKVDVLNATAEMLRNQVAQKGYIDVGSGVEHHQGINRDRFDTAVAMLKDEGYTMHYVKVPQIGTQHETTMKVLAPPGTKYSEVWRNRDQIQQITEMSGDGGRTFYGIKPPISINSNRVQVNYAEHGGDKADGVIFVRPGVDDVSLGGSRYAQVRVAVDGTHYLKGMAMYKTDMPDGVDLVFNTAKSQAKLGPNKLDAMKEMSDDPDNPFGSAIRKQIGKTDEHGRITELTSVMNVVNEEGRWDEWSRNLSSQVLSKQSPALIRQQLDMTYERRQNEFNAIMKLNNPAVRKKLLETFADGTDSAAVHLKAASLPRQSSQVLLPVHNMKPTEVYARNFRNGERVVLVRHPHGGPFEIPELTVNNNHPTAKSLIGQAKDAVGIHPSVAEKLSGADFDGDAVLVIPNNSNRIRTAPTLERLKGFDAKSEYPAYEGMKPMSSRTKDLQMGVVSNLITDMTLGGATRSELANAVRHSMVVIDAEKHNLNWKQSEIDHGIRDLQKKYQLKIVGGKERAGGASTLISRAGSRIRIDERKPRPASEGGAVDRVTGERVYVPSGRKTVNKKGEEIPKGEWVKKLEITSDARTLMSTIPSPAEKIYADHSNRLKTLANAARRESVNTTSIKSSPSAKRAFAPEVARLDAALRLAQRNAPLERQAQLLADSVVRAKRQANPDMDQATLKKIKGQALTEMRNRTGAGKQKIYIEDKEWEAIQAGAVSNQRLKDILANADLDRVKELAQPRTQILMTSSKLARAAGMLADGYTQQEVADHLGVSLTTLKTGIGGK